MNKKCIIWLTRSANNNNKQQQKKDDEKERREKKWMENIIYVYSIIMLDDKNCIWI